MGATPLFRETETTETDKPAGRRVMPPAVPTRGVDGPAPTTGSEPGDPDEAAKDGLA